MFLENKFQELGKEQRWAGTLAGYADNWDARLTCEDHELLPQLVAKVKCWHSVRRGCRYNTLDEEEIGSILAQQTAPLGQGHGTAFAQYFLDASVIRAFFPCRRRWVKCIILLLDITGCLSAEHLVLGSCIPGTGATQLDHFIYWAKTSTKATSSQTERFQGASTLVNV